jgi:hypothetical protein
MVNKIITRDRISERERGQGLAEFVNVQMKTPRFMATNSIPSRASSRLRAARYISHPADNTAAPINIKSHLASVF